MRTNLSRPVSIFELQWNLSRCHYIFSFIQFVFLHGWAELSWYRCKAKLESLQHNITWESLTHYYPSFDRAGQHNFEIQTSPLPSPIKSSISILPSINVIKKVSSPMWDGIGEDKIEQKKTRRAWSSLTNVDDSFLREQKKLLLFIVVSSHTIE